MQYPTETIDDGERWPDDKPPEPENYQYYSEGFTLYYTPKPERLEIERREPEATRVGLDTWRCPNCNYMVTNTQMQSFRRDFGCARCGTSFGGFVLVPQVQEPDPQESEGTLHEVESAWRETGVTCPHCSGDWMTYSDGVNAPQCSNPDCLAVIDDTEPAPRYCWRCERETKQVRAESGGEVWWMCNVCYECERQEWQDLRSASQSLTAAIRQRFDLSRLLAWLREKGL